MSFLKWDMIDRLVRVQKGRGSTKKEKEQIEMLYRSITLMMTKVYGSDASMADVFPILLLLVGKALGNIAKKCKNDEQIHFLVDVFSKAIREQVFLELGKKL